VRHVKELNSRLKLAHAMDFSLRFENPPVDQIPELVAFSDSSHYRDRVDDSRIGMLVFRSWGTGAGSVFHALDFAAHQLRRVAVSSKGAETQAAVKALGALRFFSAIFLQITASSLAITLVVDSLGLRLWCGRTFPSTGRLRHDRCSMFGRVVSQPGTQDCLVPNCRHAG
jgi:hypothetical protein